jgi:hypothetical protein
MTDPPPISLTTPEWQYLHDARGGEELYHWVSDPEEKINLVKSPDDQKVLEDLQTRLRSIVVESLHPWEGPEYLSALAGSGRPSAGSAHSVPAMNSSSVNPPSLPIGTSQAFFPHRVATSTRRPARADQELLQSLPYH